MKELPNIIYVTHPEEDYSNLKWIDQLYMGGIRWIQLRIKETDFENYNPDLHYKATFLEIADLLRKKTKELGMLLSINDWSEIASFSASDGLHFGKSDVSNVNDIQGLNIIGVSANQISDLKAYDLDKVNYIGVGPFRKTTTKLDTQVAVGLEGYKEWMQQCRLLNMNQPIFAIGGIALEDLKELKLTGIYGIAVSGLFHSCAFDEEIIGATVKIMQKNE